MMGRGPIVGSLVLAGLLGVLGFCRDRGPSGPPAMADYTRPTWSVLLKNPDNLPAPSVELLVAVYDKATDDWLSYWEESSGGLYRPPTIPTGHRTAVVEVVKTCSNSAEWPGEGTWGVRVTGWSCTYGEPRGPAFILSSVCHRLGHVFGGTGGNADHSKMKHVGGC